MANSSYRLFWVLWATLLINPGLIFATGSELVLSRDFQITAATGMPCPIVHPGMRIASTPYPDHRALEWQIRLIPTTENEKLFYENLNSADFTVKFPPGKGATLFWSKGSHSEISDFQPRKTPLSLGKPENLESFGGRSSDGVMPYFNLITEGGGLIIAIGWPGDWKACFELLDNNQVRIKAGLKKTRFQLKSGQNLRIPSVLVMSYRGDWLAGQNQFRNLMIKHFTPKNHPPMDLMPIAASVHGMIGFNDTTEENLIKLARRIESLKLPLDTYWLDAGWNAGGFPQGQGNPNPDPGRFPMGLGPLGRVIQKTGMKFLVWFEPERVMAGTQIEREHPEWILKPTGTPPALNYMEKDGFRILDLGKKEARNWALESVSNDITNNQISIYRQDFNAYPSYFWQTGETANDAGLREVLYINGLYDFLDDLVRRHPGIILDNCASGGRRSDFEMMRRSVVLWRSDSCWDDKSYPRNVQAMTYGLSFWLPLHGLGSHKTDDISLRSGMGACSSFPINFNDSQSAGSLRRHLDKYLKIRHLFGEQYYPLTEWTDQASPWIAFQFHHPVTGQGIIQAFHGPGKPSETIHLKPQNLIPDGTYLINNWDSPEKNSRRNGSELMKTGIEFQSTAQAQAIVLQYIKAP